MFCLHAIWPQSNQTVPNFPICSSEGYMTPLMKFLYSQERHLDSEPLFLKDAPHFIAS